MNKKRSSCERISHKQRDWAKRIGEILDVHVPECEIPLSHEDPFTLLCAVLLSAQCTDLRVNQVTPALFGLANTAEQMAATSLEKIEDIIRPCGLYRNKARALQAMAKLIVERHGGQVPADLEQLEQLPGVGHKTASVVMVQAFGQPAFPVDTHIARCAKRWGLSSSDDVDVVESRLKKLFPVEQWGRKHLQIILFARAFCPARGHHPEACPICREMGKEAPKSPSAG
jgi:endonuclease-3